VPPPHERDHDWAARIGDQLSPWDVGGRTEALVFDATGGDRQVNSGVDSKLTAAASAVIDEMIAAGEVGTSPDSSGNHPGGRGFDRRRTTPRRRLRCGRRPPAGRS
jgi:hypothetical protein